MKNKKDPNEVTNDCFVSDVTLSSVKYAYIEMFYLANLKENIYSHSKQIQKLKSGHFFLKIGRDSEKLASFFYPLTIKGSRDRMFLATEREELGERLSS